MKINTRLLPIKAHYFFFWGGLAGVMPFITIIGKDLGMSPSLVGLVATLFPFASMVAKPLVGSIADRFQKLKLIMVIFLAFTALSYFGINFIPNKEAEPIQTVFLCSNGGSEFALDRHYYNSCITDLEERMGNITVNLHCSECDLKNGTVRADYSNVTVDQLICMNPSQRFNFTVDSYVKRAAVNIWFPVDNLEAEPPHHCDLPKLYECQMKTSPTTLESCYVTSIEPTNFWFFIILFILCRTGTSVLISLSDTACFELLEGQYHLYGKQRFWGAVGWGVFSLIISYLTQLATANHSINGKTNYSPGFYTLAISMTISLIIISISDIRSPQEPGKIVKNVGKLLKNIEVIVFLFGVLAMGILTGIFWNFYFWYLSELGAQSLLFGFSLSIQCFLGELPFFFIAGWIIAKIGNRNAMTMALGAFGIRFLLYSFLTNPWYTLPIDLLQGVTFGLFYTLMATYAKAVAPVGTEATIQGLVGGTFEGLGLALGGLLGGQGFSYFGGRVTFRITAVFAAVCCVLHLLADIGFTLRKPSNQNRDPVQRPVAREEEETSFLKTSLNSPTDPGTQSA